jgi:hypothetical protein
MVWLNTAHHPPSSMIKNLGKKLENLKCYTYGDVEEMAKRWERENTPLEERDREAKEWLKKVCIKKDYEVS